MPRKPQKNGLINYLVSIFKFSRLLRRTYTFKILKNNDNYLHKVSNKGKAT